MDRAPQRTCAEHRVVATVGEEQLRRLRELDAHVLVLQTLLECVHHQIDDLRDLLARQLVEHHDVVDAVEELWTEVLLELLVHLRLHLLVGGLGVVTCGEAEVQALRDVAGTQVRRHDDHGVLEVDDAALRIGQSTIFENLQQ